MRFLKRILTVVALIACLLSFTCFADAALVEQWASTVIGFSSQYNTADWAAYQALDAPNTFEYGDIVTAWAPLPINGTKEYITLGFTTPVYASSVTIRETDGNGFVYQLDVVDQGDALHTVWTGTDPSLPGTPVDFTITFPQTPYLVKGVKIYTDTDHNLQTWEEIDAVKLTGSTVFTALPAVNLLLLD
jgi:hypothetical protein